MRPIIMGLRVGSRKRKKKQNLGSINSYEITRSQRFFYEVKCVELKIFILKRSRLTQAND